MCNNKFFPKYKLLSQFFRFVIVGCVATAIHYGVYYLLLYSFSHNFAFSIGYVLSFIVNYLLTTSFTFQTEKSYGNGLGFAICHLMNYALQVLLLNIFIAVGIIKELAPLPVYAICVPVNFLLVRLVMSKYNEQKGIDCKTS